MHSQRAFGRLISGVVFVVFSLLAASCGGSSPSTVVELKETDDPAPAATTCFLEEIEDEYGMMVEVETCE